MKKLIAILLMIGGAFVLLSLLLQSWSIKKDQKDKPKELTPQQKGKLERDQLVNKAKEYGLINDAVGWSKDELKSIIDEHEKDLESNNKREIEEDSLSVADNSDNSFSTENESDSRANSSSV